MILFTHVAMMIETKRYFRLSQPNKRFTSCYLQPKTTSIGAIAFSRVLSEIRTKRSNPLLDLNIPVKSICCALLDGELERDRLWVMRGSAERHVAGRMESQALVDPKGRRAANHDIECCDNEA